MSYDHVLLPSGIATSTDAVEAYLATQQGQPETAAVAGLAAELNRRNEALPEGSEPGDFLSVPVGGDGAALYVATPYDAIGYVRALLFDLATPRDYALYDPQLDWLIDPAGRIDVEVTHGGAGEFPYLTEPLAHQWVAGLSEPNPYLIVGRDAHRYIQTFRDEHGTYTVEYRDGGPDRHFGLQVADPGRVAGLIWDWTAGDRTRLDALNWEKVDF